MSEDVVYSEVVFVKRNKVDKDDPDECHLGDLCKAPQKAKRCCDCVRMVLLLLCILLMDVYTEKKLEDLQQVHNVLNENLKACPKNWEYHAGKCYLFSTNKLSWTDSRDACISDGGHLVIINSRDEQEFLIGIIKTEESFWIGLTDEKLEGQWLWVDNTNLCKDESYWTRKEPDNWKGYGESTPAERTVLTYIKTPSRTLRAGLMQSALKHSEEYVRPDPPDKHSGRVKLCVIRSRLFENINVAYDKGTSVQYIYFMAQRRCRISPCCFCSAGGLWNLKELW